MRSGTIYECVECGERRHGPITVAECPVCQETEHRVFVDFALVERGC